MNMFPLALYLEQSEHSLLTLSVHMDSDFSPGRGLQIYAPHPCSAGVPTWRQWHYGPGCAPNSKWSKWLAKFDDYIISVIYEDPVRMFHFYPFFRSQSLCWWIKKMFELCHLKHSSAVFIMTCVFGVGCTIAFVVKLCMLCCYCPPEW